MDRSSLADGFLETEEPPLCCDKRKRGESQGTARSVLHLPVVAAIVLAIKRRIRKPLSVGTRLALWICFAAI